MSARAINDNGSLFRLGLLADAMDRLAAETYALAQTAIQSRQGGQAFALVQEYMAYRRVAERTRTLIAQRTASEGRP